MARGLNGLPQNQSATAEDLPALRCWGMTVVIIQPRIAERASSKRILGSVQLDDRFFFIAKCFWRLSRAADGFQRLGARGSSTNWRPNAQFVQKIRGPIIPAVERK